MSKAYDRTNWDFIKQTLITLRSYDHFIHFIMRCITFTSMAIQFNDCTSQSFKPSRGLQQDDPLSPFSFNLLTQGALWRVFPSTTNFQP